MPPGFAQKKLMYRCGIAAHIAQSGEHEDSSEPPHKARNLREINSVIDHNIAGAELSMSSTHYAIELLFKALADRTRLRIINLIGANEICVCFLVEVLNINQPKISRHLSYLRRAKVVRARRDGKWMHYRIVELPDPHAASIFREVRRSLANDSEMQRDRARLHQICCATMLPIALRNAPRPSMGQSEWVSGRWGAWAAR